MNGKPNKAQQDFHDWARCEYGCVVSGMNCDAIHHIKGARMKLKGVKGAGEWFNYLYLTGGTKTEIISELSTSTGKNLHSTLRRMKKSGGLS